MNFSAAKNTQYVAKGAEYLALFSMFAFCLDVRSEKTSADVRETGYRAILVVVFTAQKAY